jgi:molybdenum cofactor synthesis domain-containing protein
MRERTCALIVIGNEILSGKVQDTNAWFAARHLREIGVSLQRIAVIPDGLEEIAREVRQCAQEFEFVLTSGGVGPTHDDMTIQGVAIAFGRDVVRHPQLEAIIREHMGERANAAALKMAEIPQGADLISSEEVVFPTVKVENVYLLPGIPQIFEAKLLALKSRFVTDPYFSHAVYTSAGEGAIAEHLNSTLARFPDLLLGSYPKIGNSEYRVKLTLESKDRSYLEQAFRHLLELLPREVVIKTE